MIVQRDPVSYLRSFLSERESRRLHPHDVVYVLKTAARELLPSAGMQKCKQLSLFADLAVHNELDRSAEGQTAIAAIAEAIPFHGQPGRDNKWLEAAINDAVSFGGLRHELLTVSQQFGLPDFFFSSWESWQQFALPLAFEISGRPVSLGTKTAKTVKARIATSGLPSHHQPRSLQLLLDTSTNGRAWWQIETDVAMLRIQVLYGGFRPSDFNVPAPVAANT
jgi:hypothetical protein